MKQQSLTWLTWKKAMIILVIIIVILLAIYLITTVNYIKKSKTDGFLETESTILAETKMTEIDQMYVYQDEVLYHIAYARDKQDNDWIIYVPKTQVKNTDENKGKKEDKKETKEKKIISIEANKVLSQEDIESTWINECGKCTLKSSAPAMIDNTPLWEVTYIDEKNRFVMEYRQLDDAKLYEQLKLRRKYNMKG